MLNLETFKQYWDKQFPDLRLRRSNYLLAVSGGLDSVVLAHLMRTVNAKCTIAHVNFQLRGEESIRDENFVRAYAEQLQFECKVAHFETASYAELHKQGIQAAARDLRYTWFENLIADFEEENQNELILLTAHHADDQVETVLMQLFRGTGLHGLTGMPNRRKDALNLARPLLIFSKEEIKQYADANSLTYVEDSSNEKDDYTRNMIRHKIVPQMEEIYPTAKLNVLATVEKLKEAEQIVSETVTAFWKKGMQFKKGIPSISIEQWNKVKENSTYVWGLVKQYGFKPQQIEEVNKIVNASKGAYINSNTHRIIKWDDQIQIVSLESNKEYELIELGQPICKTKWGQLQIEQLSIEEIGEINKDPKFAYIDAANISWPLLFRSWESTDYFYPLGLRKKKKLNQFLGSLKLNPTIKFRTGVITCSDKILWIVGQRIDDRFKITSNTKLVLKITFQDTF